MRASRVMLACGMAIVIGSAVAADTPSSPPYQIVLRSRRAEATPSRDRDAQTGGGSIVVEQPEPHTIVVTMAGAAVAGSDCKCSSAGIDFRLDQELEILPTRTGVRPPRVGMVGRLIGTLQVTEPSRCCFHDKKACGKGCGSAEQGSATATLASSGTSVLTVNVDPTTIGCGQEIAVNHRCGPVESPAAVGCYNLAACFRIGASQGKGIFNRQAAVADFDPAPQLDPFWADALKPFRAVPRRDFGFRVVVRVVEDTAQ